MMSLPTGTVTFLFTDIEGSTRLWEQHPQAMRDAVARHDALMHQAIGSHGGVVFKTMGDAFCAAFGTALQALDAALNAQSALQRELWPDPLTLRVRMALHTGTAEERGGDYFGPPLNRVSRLLSAGYGGQTLLSQTAYELTRDALPPECLLEDLGAHALRDLTRPEHVYQLRHPDLPAAFPPLKSLDHPAMPNNLPQQITSFVGREKELDQIKILLGKTRLLTLTGSGGAGKTRLSLQAAADVLDQFPDGVWLVELASITDPTLVPQSVATVLGIRDEPGQTITQTLIDAIKAKDQLLVLDNCEHLLDACAALSEALLHACPSLHILASSREGLNVMGEQTYRVPSLSLPDLKIPPTADSLSQYEAVRLFIARSILVKPDFTVTNHNAPAVASICHRVDGIPLALELAAARVRSLSVEEVNSRLDNRFRLLTGGSRTALPRQQTLRALIDWSYDLLTGHEKDLLCRLSVFSAGWTLDATEAVCTGEGIEDWEVLDLLTSLVDKSLVSAEEEGGQTRYRLLETVRQYSRDRLAECGQSASVRDKHAAHFLALAEEAAPQLGTSEQGLWLERLETEHDNFRAALAWFGEMPQEAGAMSGLRLANALIRFWMVRGYLSEGRRHLREVLAAPGVQARSVERAKALIAAGSLAQAQGDTAQASLLYTESLTVARDLGDKLRIADALGNLGTVVRDTGDYAQARTLAEESLAIARELGNKTQIALALSDLGLIAANQGDFALAQTRIEECLALYREIGHKRAIAHFSNILGSLLIDQGNSGEGVALIEECLAVHRELGYKIGIASALGNLGSYRLGQGDYDQAQSLLEESLAIDQELGNKNGIAPSLLGLGRLAREQGDQGLARQRCEQSLAVYRELGYKIGIGDVLCYLGVMASQEGDYVQGQRFAAESLAIFRELEKSSGIAEALLSLADMALNQGHSTQARSLLEESITLVRTSGDRKIIAPTLEAYARLYSAQAEFVRAARLWGASQALREAINAPFSPFEQAGYDRAVTPARESLGAEAFAAAWFEGRALTWEQAVESCLGE